MWLTRRLILASDITADACSTCVDFPRRIPSSRNQSCRSCGIASAFSKTVCMHLKCSLSTAPFWGERRQSTVEESYRKRLKRKPRQKRKLATTKETNAHKHNLKQDTSTHPLNIPTITCVLLHAISFLSLLSLTLSYPSDLHLMDPVGPIPTIDRTIRCCIFYILIEMNKKKKSLH